MLAAQLVNNDHTAIAGTGAVAQNSVQSATTAVGQPGLGMPMLLGALGAHALVLRHV